MVGSKMKRKCNTQKDIGQALLIEKNSKKYVTFLPSLWVNKQQSK